MLDDIARITGVDGSVRRHQPEWSERRAIDRSDSTVAVRVAMIAIVVLAFMLRLVAAIRLSPHVDEPASILAAGIVSEQFLPVLPSGTVYLQGFTLSLLLAPIFWAGYGDLNDLLVLRMVPMVTGTAATYLIYRFGTAISGRAWVGVTAALFLAMDPLSVQWSGHVRMYSLLQLLTIALAWVYIVLLAQGVTRRRAIAAITLSWAAVFTHVGAALLITAIGISTLILRGWRIWTYSRLAAVIGISCIAPIALLVLNRVLSPPGSTPASDGTDTAFAFVGNSQIRLFGRFLDASAVEQWASFVSPGVQFWFGPTTVVAVSSLMAAYLYLSRWKSSTTSVEWTAVIYLVTTFWVTALSFILFTASFAGRYLLHVQTTGYVLVAFLAVGVWTRLLRERDVRRVAMAILSGGLAITVMAASFGSRLQWRFEHPVVNPDYHAAMSYVSDHHRPGQPVIVSLPPVGYLGLNEGAPSDIYFLAGSRDSDRARDYSRFTEDGRRIDYWVGVETIASAEDLRLLLTKHPGALLVIDVYRLNVDWAYGNDIGRVIRSTSSVVYEGPGGAVVFMADTPVALPPSRHPD